MIVAATTNRRVLSLGFFVLICLAAASAGSVALYPKVGTWYSTLQKPDWSPPQELLFGRMWLILHAMMAVSAWLVWDRFHGESFQSLKLFAYLLGLNILWPIVFFGLQSPELAAAEVVLLWFVLTATTVAFLRVRRIAGLLLTPYWVSITYAAIANISIAQNN